MTVRCETCEKILIFKTGMFMEMSNIKKVTINLQI